MKIMTLREIPALVFLFFIPLAPGAAPAWEWHWSNPQPTGNNLIKAFFQDPLLGVVIADNGETAETRDGGETWTARPGRIPYNGLVAATTLDGALILGGAIDGKIWKTSDGGRNWRNPFQAMGSIYDIRQCGTRELVAVGAEALILASADQGENWSRIQSEEFGPDLLGLHCGEAGFAVAVGEAGSLLKSRDHGKSWIRLPEPSPEVDFTSVAFTDTSRGFATTVWGKVLDTRDGGLTWRTTILDTLTFFRGIRADGLDLTVTGSNGSLWKSSDGGGSWKQAESGTLHYLAASALTGDGSEIVIGNNGTLLRSRDDGASWNAGKVGTAKEIQGLAKLSPTTWVAFGSEGLVMKTGDRGRTWKESSLGGSAGIRAGSFLGRLGLLSTFQGGIFLSGDSGDTWKEAVVPSGLGRLFGVTWCDASTALAVGDSGALLRSSDGGQSWSLLTGIPGLTDQTLSAVGCLASGTAHIAGYRGLVLKSPDKGATWKAVPTQVAKDLFAIAFLDEAMGMAVGADGMVLLTGDGGESWTARTTGQEDDYSYGIAWLGRDTAVLVAEWLHYSRIRITTDAGKSWEELPNPTGRMLWAIAAMDSGRVAVMGQEGTLLLGNLSETPSGIRKFPKASGGQAAMRVSRMGTLPRVMIKLPSLTPKQMRITAYSLEGRFLQAVYSGHPPAGRQPLMVPFPVRRAPVVFRLHAYGDGKPADLTAILYD